MIAFFASILVSGMTGFLFVLTFWQCRKPLHCHLLIKLVVGSALGPGLSGIVFFLLLLGFGRVNSIGVVFLDTLLLFGFYGIYLYANQRHKNYSLCEKFPSTRLHFHSYLRIVWLGGLAIAIYTGVFSFISYVFLWPHGQWDAWAIWNAHARFIYRGETAWTNVFSNQALGTDPAYPWLLPSLIARSWMYTNTESALIPEILAGMFTFLTVAMLYAGVSLLREKKDAILAAIILLCTPFFIEHGSSQFADTLLGLYILLTLVLVYLYELTSDKWLLLATGVSSGLAAFTKNEGLLFFCVIMFLLLVHNKHRLQRVVKYFLLGSFPFLFATLVIKILYVPHTSTITTQLQQTFLTKLVTMQRYIIVAKEFLIKSLSFGSFFVPLPLILLFYALVKGIHIPKKEFIPMIHIFSVLVLMLGGYFLTYIITPYDLVWHVENSLDRLFIQLWPSILFLYFLLISPAPDNTV